MSSGGGRGAEAKAVGVDEAGTAEVEGDAGGGGGRGGRGHRVGGETQPAAAESLKQVEYLLRPGRLNGPLGRPIHRVWEMDGAHISCLAGFYFLEKEKGTNQTGIYPYNLKSIV